NRAVPLEQCLNVPVCADFSRVGCETNPAAQSFGRRREPWKQVANTLLEQECTLIYPEPAKRDALVMRDIAVFLHVAEANIAALRKGPLVIFAVPASSQGFIDRCAAVFDVVHLGIAAANQEATKLRMRPLHGPIPNEQISLASA